MGLDGVSVNQIRSLSEITNNDLANKLRLKNNETKAIDSLSQSQIVNPDKESHHENSSNEDDEKDEEEKEILDNELVENIDLSNTKRYELQLNEEKNEIVIIDKATDKVIQSINADKLSIFVQFLSNSKGTIINRKF